jgi:hypothetical protein
VEIQHVDAKQIFSEELQWIAEQDQHSWSLKLNKDL